jgi:hypothetical protein
MAALPSRSDMNQEKAITRKSRKNSTIKLIKVIRISMLRVLDRLLTEVSFKIWSLVSK